MGGGMGALASVPHQFFVCWNHMDNSFCGDLTFAIFLAAIYWFFSSQQRKLPYIFREELSPVFKYLKALSLIRFVHL
jgi:hypothetical protein